MSHHANKYKLGAFIVIAFSVLLISMFILGALNIFQVRIPCITVVRGSVQGLAVGAKVKYNGVPVGEVTKIKVSPMGQCVYIYMNIFPESLDFEKHGNVNELFAEFIKKEISKGLRCQLRYEGITGALYQEIQYYAVNKTSLKNKFSLPKEHPTYIPSVTPVLFDSIMKRIDTSLTKLSGIDKIFNEVNLALTKINSFLYSQRVQNAIDDFELTSKNISSITNKVNKTLTEKRINDITIKLENTISQITKLAKTIDQQIVDSNIPAASNTIRSSIQETSTKLNEAIDNFNSAAASIEALSNTLNKSPDSIIWGKENKKIVPSY